MRILKIAGWCLAGVIGLLLMGLVWLLLWFDPNSYKAEIEQLVQQKTGRQLQLHGDLKLSLFPWLAVELGQTELGNAAGFGTEPMLSVQRVRLGVRLRPLLQKRFEVGAVELEAPTLHLLKNAQGVSNWADLLEQSKQPSPPIEPAQNSNFNASVASLRINKAELSYDDQQAHSQLAVQDFSLSTGSLASGKPVALEAAFTVKRTSLVDGVAKPLLVQSKLSSTVTADLEASRYDLRKLLVDMQVTLAEGGKSIPIKIQADSIQADLQKQLADVVGLSASAAGGKLTAAFKAEQIMDAPRLSGHIDVAPLSIRELASQFDIKLPITRDAKVLQQFSLQSDLSASSKSVSFNSLLVKLDDTTLKGSAGLADFDSKALRFDLDVDHIDVDRYLTPVVEAPKDAPVSDSGPTPIPGDAIKGLNAQGELRIGQVILSGVTLSAVRVGVNAHDDQLRLKPLQATVYEGKFQGDVLIDASGRVPKLSLEEHVVGVNFAPLFKALYKTERVSGRGNINLKLTGSGADTTALKPTLNGKLDFSVDNGAFEGVDLWYEIRRARALLKQQAMPARTGTARTAFTSLSASGVVTNGVLNNQDLNADMQYLKVTGKGAANLVSNTLDYRLLAAVSKIPNEDQLAAKDAAQDLAGLSIPITVTGALTDPKLRPDVSGLLKERAKQELDKQKDKLEKKLQDKLQDKLKGLFGG